MSDEILYGLLPAIYRARDLQVGEPLRTLMATFESVYEELVDDIDRLYADFFVETCAPERLPLIGDLVGTELPDEAPAPESVRRYVANYRRYRRLTGQLSVTREVVADMTGWPCHGVDAGRMLVASPDLRRPTPAVSGFDMRARSQAAANVAFGVLGVADDGASSSSDEQLAGSVDLKRAADLPWLETPFDPFPRSVDLRRWSSAMPGRPTGHHTLFRLELYLFRLFVQPLEWMELTRDYSTDAGMAYVVDPLQRRVPLFNGLRPGPGAMVRDRAPTALTLQTLAEAMQRAGNDPARAPVRIQLEYGASGDTASVVELQPVDIGVAALDPWPTGMPGSLLALVDPEAGRVMLSSGGRLGYPKRARLNGALASGARIGGGGYRGPRAAMDDDGVDWIDAWQIGSWFDTYELPSHGSSEQRLELRRRFGFQDAQGREDVVPSRPDLTYMPIDPADFTDPYAVDQREALSRPLQFRTLSDALDWLEALASLDRTGPAYSDPDADAHRDLKYRRMQRAGVRLVLCQSSVERFTAQVTLFGRPVSIYARPGTRPCVRGLLDLQCAVRTRVDIDGLLWGGGLRAEGDVRLTVRDCTVRPSNVTLSTEGIGDGSLSKVPDAAAELKLIRSVVARLRIGRVAGRLIARDSVIDDARDRPDTHQPAEVQSWTAPNPEIRIGIGHPGVGYADVFDEQGPGGVVAMKGVTVIGRFEARVLDAVDSLFADPLRVVEQDEGQVSHCYIPDGSRTPRRVRCAEQADGVRPPRFIAREPADPRFALLDADGDPRVLEGSTEGAEMGVYAHLEVPRRLRQLERALDRFLPLTYETEVILVADAGPPPPAAESENPS